MITGEELAAYAAGEADPALVARVESALPGDPELATRLERIRAVDAELAAWPTPTLSADAADRLMAAVDAELATLAGDETASTTGARPRDVDATASTIPHGRRGRAGGSTATTGRAAGGSTAGRLGGWLSGLVDGMGAPQLAGAVAALVVVVAVGAVVTGGGMSGNDSASVSADAGQALETLDNEAGGSASRGTETAMAADDAAPESAHTEAMMPETASESGEGADDGVGSSEVGMASGSPPVVVIDDARVVARVADVDAAALRDRLEPLVDHQAGAPAAELPPETETSSTGSPRPMADGRVEGRDVEAATECLGDLGPVVVAEVVTLAPDRDAVLYVQEDRVVVVGLDDCTRLGVVRG